MKTRKDYKTLLKHIGKCPDEQVGKWATDTMKALDAGVGQDTAVHFAQLLVSGDGPMSTKIDRCLAYLRHHMDQLEVSA